MFTESLTRAINCVMLRCFLSLLGVTILTSPSCWLQGERGGRLQNILDQHHLHQGLGQARQRGWRRPGGRA